ncbi:MAG: aldolase/citrate lyase family protein [Pseudomonadota bacterium]
MAIIENVAKQKLVAGELAIGFGLRSMRTVDAGRVAAACGFDWLFIDMEHGSFDVDLACQISVAALDAGVTPIPRGPGHQHFHSSRVLDGGSMGVVVPHVDTVEQATRAVSNCKFPPVGHRSMVGGLAQLGYDGGGSVAEQAQIMNDNTLVVVMLETPEAIENADAIAAVPGIDVLLIGTNDLSAEMGIPGEFGHERVTAAYEATISAARNNGKFAGMGGVYDQELSTRYISMGAQFLLGGSDMSLMMGAAKARSSFLHSIKR